jgi:hypothetical protein
MTRFLRHCFDLMTRRLLTPLRAQSPAQPAPWGLGASICLMGVVKVRRMHAVPSL